MTPPAAIDTIVVVAGRRIDAAGTAHERFPLRNCGRVRDAITSTLVSRPASLLICSAACGTDLIALEAAEGLRIPFRIVLPFSVERFRASSVTDRPGDWGPVFDRLIADASARGELLVLQGNEENAADDAYAKANTAILDEGDALAATLHAARVALIAWDDKPRNSTDFTEQFRSDAASRGWTIETIRTL